MPVINQQKIKHNLILIIAALLILMSCGKKNVEPEKEKIPEKNMEFLNSLTKLESYEMGEIQINSKTTLVYTEDGKRCSEQEVIKLATSKDYAIDFYKNKDNQVIFLYKYLTEDMRRQRAISDSLNNIKADLVGKPAIPFSVTDIHDNEFSIERLKGKVVVMNFWFIACSPCVAEMPGLNKLVEEYKKKEVVFLGFSTDKKEQIENFLTKKTFDFNIIPTSDEVCKSYNVWLFPTTVVIDKNSRIVYYKKGSLDEKTTKELKENIDLQLTKM